MKCRECGGGMERLEGPYHFTESGLEDAYLEGECVRAFRCPACGEESVSIQGVAQVMDVLAEAVANKEDRLLGEEVRFLRKRIPMKAVEFAGLLGMDPSALSRVENGRDAVSSHVDRLARVIYRRPEETRALLSKLTGHSREGSHWTLKGAIQDGLESGVSNWTLDDIWAEVKNRRVVDG